MSYARLRDRLSSIAEESKQIVTLPDGSVDYCYRVTGAGGDRVESPAALGRHLRAGDGETFPIELVDVRPGGQAVNAATQVHALGDDATVVGHLDHEVLADLPFETHSMGPPAAIHVFAFDGEEVLFPERSSQPPDWNVDDLTAVVDWDRIAAADALCCTNWAIYRGLTGVLDRLAESADGVPVVVDPGAIELVVDADLETLLDALARAESSIDVALSVNRTEYETVAAVAGVPGEPTTDHAEAVRSALGISAVVYHGADDAIAATPSDTISVAMLETGDPTLTLGAGDRFSGALACALARDWPWEAALSLGNACAAAFVESAETADSEALDARLRDHR
ncbi:carbohydrate kinase family protein [Halosolutus amylolyticus]|uniref:Carbohydrate kinase family protein n=1 Tax=Halosolutus amylolyticus TaxID=2932267 RepID=A0ABD5PW51_9EURY|nr:carbohydrate kinase family protein [Halosolutus amylolyticus]